MPRRRDREDGKGGGGDRRPRSPLPRGVTLTAARRGRSKEPTGGKRHHGSNSNRSNYHRSEQEVKRSAEQAKAKLRLHNHLLGVDLLKGYDDQKTTSAEEMEEHLSAFFLQRERKQVTSEIFCRGILRAIGDVDRLLRSSSKKEHIDKVTGLGKQNLSIIRVLSYELMWVPKPDFRWVSDIAKSLMDKLNVQNEEQKVITDSLKHMWLHFVGAHRKWDENQKQRAEKKKSSDNLKETAELGSKAPAKKDPKGTAAKPANESAAETQPAAGPKSSRVPSASPTDAAPAAQPKRRPLPPPPKVVS